MQAITYANTYGEIVLLQLVTIVRSKWTYLLLAFGFFAVLPGNISSVPDDTTTLIGFLTVAIMQTVLLLAIGTLALAAQVIVTLVAMRRKGLLEHTVTIDSETITEQTSEDTTVSRWSGVYRVTRTKDLVFVYLNPLSAHAIPRRAVNGDWDRFFDTLLGHWQAARA